MPLPPSLPWRERAEAVVMAGADSVAVVSAICTSPDPYAASRELTGIIDSALASRPHRIKYRQLTRS